MKKVIFVGGTSFSGSTFFHMILANDPKGFAFGEIRWLFSPHRPHHVNRLCGCGDKNCQVWSQIYRNGEDNLYESIFKLFPEVEFIVDSSKNPFWINKQTKLLKKKGIQTANILIWKTPLEFANSSKKRGRFENWNKEWVNYHRLYSSLISDWKGVKYCDIVNDKAVLKEVCNYLAIPYFPQKSEYWEKTYHSFGGNISAQFHLHKRDVAQKNFLDKTHDTNRMDLYRKVYYTNIDDQSLQQVVKNTIKASDYFDLILQLLETRDVTRDSGLDRNSVDIHFPIPLIQLRWLKYMIKNQIGRYKYGRQFSY